MPREKVRESVIDKKMATTHQKRTPGVKFQSLKKKSEATPTNHQLKSVCQCGRILKSHCLLFFKYSKNMFFSVEQIFQFLIFLEFCPKLAKYPKFWTKSAIFPKKIKDLLHRFLATIQRYHQTKFQLPSFICEEKICTGLILRKSNFL